MKTGLMAIVALAISFPAWSADAPASGTKAAAEPTPEQIVAQFRDDLQAKSADVMAKALTLTADQATSLKATVLNAVTTLVDRKAPAKATTP